MKLQEQRLTRYPLNDITNERTLGEPVPTAVTSAVGCTLEVDGVDDDARRREALAARDGPAD